jgi:hypothetical protein
VAFESGGTNLVPADTNGTGDVFVRDRLANTTERVSLLANGSQHNFGDGWSFPSISGDGRYVAIQGSLGARPAVYVRDRLLNLSENVSVNSQGAPGAGGFGSGRPSISADGRFVAFVSSDTNLVVGDTNEADDVFVRDRDDGKTERVSGAIQSGAPGFGVDPFVSGNGLAIAFTSDDSKMYGSGSELGEIFVRSYDEDGDQIHEVDDNCPDHYNPEQQNSDGDQWADACELPGCENIGTAWSNPSGDGDCDGFPNSSASDGRGHEAFMGTDTSDRCPDNPTDQAWPPDMNNNGVVNLTDVIAFGPVFNTVGPSPPYNSRFDLTASPQPNGAVNLSDVIVMGPFFNRACTP